MAKTQFIDIADEMTEAYRSALEQRDRFILGVVQGHKRMPSKQRRKEIQEMSLFGFLAQFWRALTPEQKDAWSSASQYSNLTNWQLFISDNAARIRHDLALAEPPSDLWQVKTGYLTIEAPADRLVIKQTHPQEYYAVRKITGASWKEELVHVTEEFSLPLEIKIRYKSALTAEGPNQSAQYIARIWSSYQGQDIYTDLVINFNPETDWTLANNTISNIKGILIGYDLYINITGYRGSLFYDNIRAIHSGVNWARDPRADYIDREFEGAFSVSPPYWLAVDVPTGANYKSIYPPSL